MIVKNNNLCMKRIRWNTKSIIEFLSKKFDYDYSRTIYVKNDVHIYVNCKKHGVFKILPKNHINGDICPKCFKENEINRLKKDFIKKSKEMHDDNKTNKETKHNVTFANKLVLLVNVTYICKRK